MCSRLEKVLRGAGFGVLLALFFALPGCPVADDGLTDGDTYEVELQLLADGTLYAVEIEASDDGEQDGENDEQDGENEDDEADADDEGEGEDVEQEGENEDGDDDENEDEDEDGEAELTAQVDSVAADCSSFTVLGSLVVVLDADEDDDEDVEQEGEHEGENEGEGLEMLQTSFLIPDSEADPVLEQAEGEEDDGEIGICDLAVGMWIEAEGEYEDGIFEAEEIEIADEEETEIEAAIGDLTGSTFTMLGLTITYDSGTEIDLGDEGEDEDGEDDGEECEQEGENEGENEGC